MAILREGILLGLGNPLLDITSYVDKEFLDKYNLKANDAILADERHSDLFKEMIEKYDVVYTAGGQVQNTMRSAQWMIGTPNCATFMGTISDDREGKTMEEQAKKDGVNTIYMIDNSVPTGKCAVLITDQGRNRSLAAFLGASQRFRKQHIIDNYHWVEKAKVLYVSGFHVAVCPEAILELARHAHSNPGKVFAMNLSAPYISSVYSKPFLELFPYIDILFGNESEAAAFAQMKGWKTDNVKEIAKLIANEPYNRKESRLVIITQGKDPVLVAKSNQDQVKEYETIQLDEKDIIDTNSAGDSFVGGFLAQFIQDEPLDICLKSAIYLASEVIQLNGCLFPSQNKFTK